MLFSASCQGLGVASLETKGRTEGISVRVWGFALGGLTVQGKGSSFKTT
jgi:hypothetical protein